VSGTAAVLYVGFGLRLAALGVSRAARDAAEARRRSLASAATRAEELAERTLTKAEFAAVAALDARERRTRSIVILLFTMYGVFAKLGLSAVICVRARAGTTTRLVLDVQRSIVCFEGGHVWVFCAGVVVLCAVVVGLPVGTMSVLRRLHGRGLHDDEHWVSALGAMYLDYRRTMYNTSGVWMGFLASQAVLSLGLWRWPVVQASIGVGIGVVLIAFFGGVQPYESSRRNVTAVGIMILSMYSYIVRLLGRASLGTTTFRAAAVSIVVVLVCVPAAAVVVAWVVSRRRRRRRVSAAADDGTALGDVGEGAGVGDVKADDGDVRAALRGVENAVAGNDAGGRSGLSSPSGALRADGDEDGGGVLRAWQSAELTGGHNSIPRPSGLVTHSESATERSHGKRRGSRLPNPMASTQTL
jgi:hypothetical protein